MALALAAAIASWNGRAAADATPADKATAQALFDDGMRLLKLKSYAEACPKLAESLRLDPALGTKLYLADCYEKNGQTASAWALFREAAEQAKIAGQAERAKKAEERATALAARLCRLRIDVSTEAEVTGVEVTRDGTVIGSAIWGTAVPLDPGEHRIRAEAPGKKPWTATVVLKDGETAPVVVTIPALEELPKPPEPPKVEPPKVGPPTIEPPRPPDEPPKVEPPKVEPPKVEPPKVGPPTIEPPRTPRTTPPPAVSRIDEPPPPSAGRKVGYALTAVGGAGTAVGGVFGMIALVKNSDAAPNCKQSNACNQEGTTDRTQALRFANISSVTLIAGGSVFVAGIITLIATRAPEPPEKLVLSVSPLIGQGTGGVLVGGSF
ncbi:MAG: hypothetical protein U0359_36055 [Byssovorax sp.]